MRTKIAAATALVLVLIVILCIHYWNREGFSSSRQRATTIVKWFSENPNHKYVDFRDDTKGNIVEYHDALDLKRNDKLNIDNLSILV